MSENEKVEAPSEDEVLAKAADGEVLTLEELQVINRPPARVHNDEADIGVRYEGAQYAPAAQPDLNAPAYILALQAQREADGEVWDRSNSNPMMKTSDANKEAPAKKASKK